MSTSASETNLIRLFEELDDIGKTKVLDYLEDLTSIRRYRKFIVFDLNGPNNRQEAPI